MTVAGYRRTDWRSSWKSYVELVLVPREIDAGLELVEDHKRRWVDAVAVMDNSLDEEVRADVLDELGTRAVNYIHSLFQEDQPE